MFLKFVLVFQKFCSENFIQLCVIGIILKNALKSLTNGYNNKIMIFEKIYNKHNFTLHVTEQVGLSLLLVNKYEQNVTSYP